MPVPVGVIWPSTMMKMARMMTMIMMIVMVKLMAMVTISWDQCEWG